MCAITLVRQHPGGAGGRVEERSTVNSPFSKTAPVWLKCPTCAIQGQGLVTEAGEEVWVRRSHSAGGQQQMR